MKLLMHLCCALCAAYPLEVLRERGISLTGLWYNPNIHPFTEYRSRLGALRQLQALWDLDVRYNDEYGLKKYLQEVSGNKEARCAACYRMRLEETARTARETGADAFTTSLFVSPYQDFGLIVETGRALEGRYDVEFYVEDFRGGFREGQRMARGMGLYRQNYCGCIYSEMERYPGRREEMNQRVMSDEQQGERNR